MEQDPTPDGHPDESLPTPVPDLTRPGLRVDRTGAVAILTLDRPARLNAVDQSLTDAIAAALTWADTDAGVRVVCLASSTDRAFCAGVDLVALERDGVPPDGPDGTGFAGIVAHPISIPLVCAVNGAVVGGGLEIMLTCDLVIAGEGARFGLPEVRRGLIASAGGATRTARLIPPRVAMYLALTGDTLDAAAALAAGLVNEVVPDGQVRSRALTLARQIADRSPEAVRGARELVRTGAGWDLSPAEWEQNLQWRDRVIGSADAAAAIAGFLRPHH